MYDARVELSLAGTWTDVTSYTRLRDGILIDRGRPDEASVVERGSCRVTLDNRDGRFVTRNPSGAYYGSLTRNTPLRVTMRGLESPYLASPDGVAGVCTAPDSAALSITGDIDIRVDVTAVSWTALANLAYKWGAVGQYSWKFIVDAGGLLWLFWSPDGTAYTVIPSTVPVPAPWSGRKTLRVTLDVNNGAGGNDIAFWVSDSVTGTWTQIGDTVTTAGVASIFDSTAPLTLDTSATRQRINHAQVRNGIAGAVVANPDFSLQAVGAGSFTDSAGVTWTVSAPAVITDITPRYSGEVSSWPIAWDPSAKDSTTTIEASGILRRLGQGSALIQSTMRRGLLSVAPKAYWPCEDGPAATSFATAIAGGTTMTWTGTPTLAVNTAFEASDPLPVTGLSRWIGQVPPYTATGQIQARFLMLIPSTGSTTGDLLNVDTTGTAVSWALRYISGAGGGLRLLAIGSSGATILDTGTVPFLVDGRQLLVSLELTESGADTLWRMQILEVGQSLTSYNNGTLAGYGVGAATKIYINYFGAHDQVVVGHVSVESAVTNMFTLAGQLNAWRMEYAGTRIARLCAEENIPISVVGPQSSTSRMGAQSPNTLIALLREAEAVDGGVLMEPREYLGLLYRTRESMCHQTANLTIDYVVDGLNTITPVDDDQLVRNDVTVSRTGGSSTQMTLTSGPLSTSAPPNGVGRYPDSLTLNIASDGGLLDQAGWHLHLGTVDEARYPVISHNLVAAAFPTIGLASLRVDVGDRLAVTTPPPQLPPDDVSQLVQGITEQITPWQDTLSYACSPESPWRVGVWDAVSSRYSSDGSTLAANVTSSATSWSVSTPTGPLWSTAGGDYPLDFVCGGERVTVTAVAGAASPQTFTVTRSVNSVVAAHTSGAVVALYAPVYYAI